MAESRVEKYREYRKSIISNGSPVLKEEIDTTLTSTKSETPNVDLTNEYKLANGLKKKEFLELGLLIAFIVVILTLLIVYGVKVF